MIRIIQGSIAFLLSAAPGGSPHMLFIMGSISRTMRTAMGPTVTTNSVGRMQKKIGKTSLTPSLAAFSSATWRA